MQGSDLRCNESIYPPLLTIYVSKDQVKATRANLKKDCYKILSEEYITRGKVVIVAQDTLFDTRKKYSGSKTI